MIRTIIKVFWDTVLCRWMGGSDVSNERRVFEMSRTTRYT